MTPIGVLSGDITRIPADAFVNSATACLLAGGVVCGAIHRAAGADLERACRVIGSCPTCYAVSTPASPYLSSWSSMRSDRAGISATPNDEKTVTTIYEKRDFG